MTDYLREFLYPIGFLAAIAFSGRMLLQWITSEAKKQSVVVPLFWKLSLCGNLLLAFHSLIQVQFHVCVIQTCNAVISWRNLNLMQPKPQQISTMRTITLLVLAVTATVAIFLLQGYFLLDNTQEWFRIPVAPWQSKAHSQVSLAWHLFGFVGLTLFSSRFWLQWWLAERHQKSFLGAAFWWTSLLGEGICLIYFVYIDDPVNYLGPAFAMIPYIRNLMLIYRKPRKSLSNG